MDQDEWRELLFHEIYCSELWGRVKTWYLTYINLWYICIMIIHAYIFLFWFLLTWGESVLLVYYQLSRFLSAQTYLCNFFFFPSETIQYLIQAKVAVILFVKIDGNQCPTKILILGALVPEVTSLPYPRNSSQLWLYDYHTSPSSSDLIHFSKDKTISKRMVNNHILSTTIQKCTQT